MASTLRKEWDLWRGSGRGSYGDVSLELLLMMRDWGISMGMLMGGIGLKMLCFEWKLEGTTVDTGEFSIDESRVMWR